jgi:hypothetical protein
MLWKSLRQIIVSKDKEGSRDDCARHLCSRHTAQCLDLRPDLCLSLNLLQLRLLQLLSRLDLGFEVLDGFELGLLSAS